ncbi:MAG TPA: amidohydrolase family protein [Vicinamibacterales bacterium]|nr:amidohydrolase family protein [Vicinamibacterales bacterium]
MTRRPGRARLPMTRRAFVRGVAGTTAGMLLSDGLLDAGLQAMGAQAGTAARRREVSIGGRRITVVDIHAHTFVPEVWDLVKDTPLAAAARNNLTGAIALGPGTAARLQYMDKEGIDYQVINVNAWGYAADRELARDLIQVQNQMIARACAARPDRFVGMATLALQHPELAAEQLDVAVRRLGLRGAAIGGSVEGVELSDRRFDPLWAKAEELGTLLFMHPQTAPGTTDNPRLRGRGGLGNTIGNPLETTVFLSHLIFEGVLDRFPGLKICAAHAGGYLPSYSGRSDALCGRGGGASNDCTTLRRKPSEYFKGPLYIDTMVFHAEGLRHLVAEVGADHIFYGTDYPFDWPVGIDFVLDAPFLRDADKAAILGGNLVKLLRIT